MKILGITGRSGSGKGYICALLAERGIPTIDTDCIVHALYRQNKACIDELETAFGPLQTSIGEIDRKKLGRIVFSDEEKLKTLNSIVHRYVAQEIKTICVHHRREGSQAVLIDAPQLYEAHLEGICDLVIAVVAPEDERTRRICARDAIPEESAAVRLSHQLSDDFFKSHADIVIINDGQSDLTAQMDALLDRIET